MKSVLIALIILFGISAESVRADHPKVGIVLPLSGILAEYGVAARNGFEMARGENPELFQNLELVYEDSRWDSQSAVASFHKLRTTPGVFMIYNWGTLTTAALAPLAEKYRLPLIGMSIGSEISGGRQYVIRGTNPTGDFARKLTDRFKQQGYRKIGVVLSNIAYTSGLYDDISRQLNPDQSIEIVSNHNLDDSDFRAPIARLRQKHYDALGVFLVSGQLSQFYRQLKQAGAAEIPTFGTDFFESETEFKNSDGAMEGAIYPHLDTNPEFAENYRELHGNDLQLAYAGNAFDIAMMIGKLFGGDHRVTPSSAQTIAALKSADASGTGVCGARAFRATPDGDAYYEFPAVLKVVRNGRFLALESADPVQGSDRLATSSPAFGEHHKPAVSGPA